MKKQNKILKYWQWLSIAAALVQVMAAGQARGIFPAQPQTGRGQLLYFGSAAAALDALSRGAYQLAGFAAALFAFLHLARLATGGKVACSITAVNLSAMIGTWQQPSGWHVTHTMLDQPHTVTDGTFLAMRRAYASKDKTVRRFVAPHEKTPAGSSTATATSATWRRSLLLPLMLGMPASNSATNSVCLDRGRKLVIEGGRPFLALYLLVVDLVLLFLLVLLYPLRLMCHRYVKK